MPIPVEEMFAAKRHKRRKKDSSVIVHFSIAASVLAIGLLRLLCLFAANPLSSCSRVPS
jgi:hypothetical protein